MDDAYATIRLDIWTLLEALLTVRSLGKILRALWVHLERESEAGVEEQEVRL